MTHKTVARPTKAAIDILGEEHFKDHVSGHIELTASDNEQIQLDHINDRERKIIYARELERKKILSDLAALDIKSIRAMREGDSARLLAIEAEAITLREKL